MTNAEKFEEIFGFKVDKQSCPVTEEFCKRFQNEKMKRSCMDCPFLWFWGKQYKPCFRLDMEKVKCTKQ